MQTIEEQNKLKEGTQFIGNGSYQILIPLNTYTKKNSQEIHYKYVRGKRVPFVAPSKNFLAFQQDCGFFLKELQIDYPVNIQAKFYMGTKRHVDIANLLESLHDVLVHYQVIVDDNALILVSTDGSRVYYDKENPRIEILITPEELTFQTEAKKKEKKKKETVDLQSAIQ